MAKATAQNTGGAFGPKTANDLWDMLQVHKQQERLGTPGNRTPLTIDKNIIKVRNGTGGNLARGSVVDVGSYLLTGLSKYQPEHFTFGSIAPAGGHYAVFRQAVESGKIEEAQLTGVCIARVNVTDAGHRFAVPTSGQTYFTSASEGEIQILDKASSGTGVKECVVVLRCGGAGESEFVGIGYTIDAIDGGDYGDPTVASWTVPTFNAGTVGLYRLDTGGSDELEAYDPDETVEAYNISSFDLAIASRVRVWKFYDRSSGAGVFVCRPYWDSTWFQVGQGYITFNGTASVGTSSTPLAMTVNSDTWGLVETDASSPTRMQFNRPGRYRMSVRVSTVANTTAGAFTFEWETVGGEVGFVNNNATGGTIPQFTASGTYTFDLAYNITVGGIFAVPKLWAVAQRPAGSGSGTVNITGILEPMFE